MKNKRKYFGVIFLNKDADRVLKVTEIQSIKSKQHSCLVNPTEILNWFGEYIPVTLLQRFQKYYCEVLSL